MGVIVLLLWRLMNNNEEWEAKYLNKENMMISAVCELENLTGKKYYFDENYKIKVWNGTKDDQGK